MNELQFQEIWRSTFGDVYPLGYQLRQFFPQRWFRIHSLPGSKRYAESKEEEQIILKRHNQLITDLLGEGTECFLGLLRYPDELELNEAIRTYYFEGFKKVWRIHPEPDDSSAYFDFFAAVITWQLASKDLYLKAAANDELRILFFCPEKQCVIAPYDGGVDVIVESENECELFKKKYRNWLSSREDGM